MRRFHNPAVLLGLFLALLVLAAYSPVHSNQFINLDDWTYITANPHVQLGLSAESIAWAFTSTTSANWHPLTMLSLQLDWQLFGNSPRAVHWTNVLLHAASSWLLLLVLYRWTGNLWPSAGVAALFALHPLRVESVAWAAERKDVLSGLFFMLTLLAYGWYAAVPSCRRYLLVAGLFTMGLLAKPMLVTVPCLCLLLDYWPLRRWRVAWSKHGPDAGPAPLPQPLGRLVLEKIPLLLLAGAASAIAVLSQRGGESLKTLADVSLARRLETALLAPVVYLRKMVWPNDLAPFYPFPRDGYPVWHVAAGTILLLSISVLCWQQRYRRPYLIVGWLWYLGMLVPVIGLVQVGNQTWADRYTYLPMIGILIAAAWLVRELVTMRVLRSEAAIGLVGAMLLLCGVSTYFQTGYWHDDKRLWTHTLEVTSKEDNDVAHNNLGIYLAGQDQTHWPQAREHFAAAVAANPHNQQAQTNLARVLIKLGETDQAVQRLETALKVNSKNDMAHVLLARLCLESGKREEGLSHLQAALEITQQNPQTHELLGLIYQQQGRLAEAAEQFAAMTQLAPNSAEAHAQLGFALCRLSRWKEAIGALGRAAALRPESAPVYLHLGYAHYEKGDIDEATAAYDAASQRAPGWQAGLQHDIWALLSGSPAESARAAETLPGAQQLCQATHFRNPQYLDTLAAVYAAGGHFAEAVPLAQRALELARATQQSDLVKQIQEHLTRYQQRQKVP
jgi:tetratricopeptide (TPR) repeat protein